MCENGEREGTVAGLRIVIGAAIWKGSVHYESSIHEGIERERDIARQ